MENEFKTILAEFSDGKGTFHSIVQISDNIFHEKETGYLYCKNSILGGIGAQKYLGKELPFKDVKPDSVVELVRESVDVFDSTSMETFNGKPVTLHHPERKVNSKNFKKFIVGSLNDVKQDSNNSDNLIGDIVIYDEYTVDKVMKGELKDLSLGYRAKVVPTGDGRYKQTDIVINHLAIVEDGRAEMAQKVALDIPDGSYVNLGIGIPEMVAGFVPEGRELIYQTENGLLGMGKAAELAKERLNQGKEKEIIRLRNKLIKEIKGGILSPTANGILVTALKIKVETYLFLKYWMGYCKKGGISELEILLLLAFSADGKALPIPFSQFYRDDEQKESYNRGCRGNYRNKLIRLVYAQGSENKKIFQDMLMLKKVKGDNEEEAITSENHLAFKKTLLLYDWIKGSKEIKTKTIEQKYDLYRGAVYRLGEGFSWLADSLAAIAESEGWKKGREEDLNTIISLSKRLIEGVKEEGLNLIRLYVPGLNRYYIGKLLGDGYKDENCLKELSKEQLSKVLPKRLVNRVQKRFALVLTSSSTKN